MRKAPFTADEVDSLNAYQREGVLHPFTCGQCLRDEQNDGVLVASGSGWHCPACDHVQDWCHDWMADWAWRDTNWVNISLVGDE